MNDNAKKLTQLRREEQEARGYATSSRWYTGLSNAISFLERAETGSDPLDRFRDSWSAAYNLFTMYGKAGDDEFKCFNSWVTELKEVPEIRRLLTEPSETSQVSSFLSGIANAKNKLLKSQGLRELESWKPGSTGPEKACRYFLTIARDMRNSCSHPDFNPSSAPIKKALATAADCLISVVTAATQSIIDHPVHGTTGKTTAYRSFLWPFLKNSDSFFSDYYLERLFPEEELSAFQEEEIKPSLKEIAKSLASERGSLMKADADGTRNKWCVPILFPALNMTLYEGVRIVSETAVFEPSYVLKREGLSGTPREEYQGKDAGRDLSCLIWILPWRSSLDVLSNDPAFESLSAMEVAHRALSSSDVTWAVITNGRQFRLLSKRTAHKPRCFLEMDLDAIIDRYADQESLNAFRYLLGLFSGPSFSGQDQNGHSLLDRVFLGSERHGKEIGDELKQNVFGALEELGDGFLHYLRTQAEELEALRQERAPLLTNEAFLSSEELLRDIYTESLSLMYRLLFLFYAESRNMLPMEDEMYRETYSLESIRDDIISVHDDPDPRRFFGRGDTLLWERLKELFEFVNHGWRKVIPVYNGGLFDTELHGFLDRFKVPDYFLARAIDLLSRTRPRSGQARGEGRKKVTYRDLDVRHLGSIYEGILEYSAHIAGEDQVVMKRGTGAKPYEEYVPVCNLTKAEEEQFKLWKEAITENPDNPILPRGCNVAGVKERGSYFLVFGGRESKRKSSGSYYTPDYIVQYIVENTLGPLVRGECRPKPEPLPEALKKLVTNRYKAPTGPLSAEEILQLKVLDPAMGSGHFLVAATEYLARAYGEALVREGKNGEGVISDEEFIRYKRMIAERCIYGVDINPMAIELAKLSIWLFTMDRGRPLSFLDHHLKCGNSLIGAWIDDLGELPEFDKKGNPKKKTGTNKQLNLFEGQFRAKVPLMIRDLFGIMEQETLSYKDIMAKKALDKAVEEIKRPFKNVADKWTGSLFGMNSDDYVVNLSNLDSARVGNSKLASDHGFFHWELEFPEVWFDEHGRPLGQEAGFSAVVGNPPYLTFGGRWTGKKDTILDSILRYMFYGSAEYKLNLYVLFKELGIRLLKEGGRISFVVPDAYLLGYYSSQIRSFILKNCQVDLLSMLFFDPWEAGDVGRTVIFVYTRRRTLSSDLNTTVIKITDDSMKPASVHIMKPASFQKEARSRFQIFFSKNDEVFFRRLQTFPKKAEHYLDFHTSLRSRLPKGKILEISKDAHDLKPCLMRGEDIECFIVVGEPLKIPIDTTLYWGGYEWKQYKSPKILVRKTGDRIIAAIERNDLLCFDNLHVLQQKHGQELLEVFVAWLNSSVLNKYYQLATLEEGRTMPQLDLDTLRLLPFPKAFDSKDETQIKSLKRIKRLVLEYEVSSLSRREEILSILENEWENLL